MTLVGCAKKHQCGKIITVEEGNVLSPWVICVFRGGGGNKITVGNQSSPSLENSAVIKSFNFGISDGGECKITIHDQQGSSLGVFLKNMVKELQGEEDRFITIQWGWTKSGCPTPPPSNVSKVHYLQLTAIETNFVQGKFIHEITATDTMNLAVQGGIENIYGETGKNAITLKEAIKKLLTEDPHPKVKSVEYCRLNNQTGVVEYDVKFKGFPNDEGPKDSWKGNAANKLETVKSWIGGFETERDKIFVPVYESTEDGGKIIFWERPVFDCDEIASQEICVGTYIVNGGSDTPVIEFNPRIKWDFGPVPTNGGQIPDATIEADGLPQNKAQGVTKCKQLSREGAKGSGQVLSTPPSEVHRSEFASDATKKKADANAKQMVQDGIHIMEDGIMADLVIVGDPTLPTQSDGVINGKTVSIAFVNPFHLLPSGSSNCGDWLSKPPCNEWLSNKNWLIQKLNHKIENGTYTTTFSLRCTSPGFDTLLDNPIGNAADGAQI